MCRRPPSPLSFRRILLARRIPDYEIRRSSSVFVWFWLLWFCFRPNAGGCASFFLLPFLFVACSTCSRGGVRRTAVQGEGAQARSRRRTHSRLHHLPGVGARDTTEGVAATVETSRVVGGGAWRRCKHACGGIYRKTHARTRTRTRTHARLSFPVRSAMARASSLRCNSAFFLIPSLNIMNPPSHRSFLLTSAAQAQW